MLDYRIKWWRLILSTEVANNKCHFLKLSNKTRPAFLVFGRCREINGTSAVMTCTPHWQVSCSFSYLSCLHFPFTFSFSFFLLRRLLYVLHLLLLCFTHNGFLFFFYVSVSTVPCDLCQSVASLPLPLCWPLLQRLPCVFARIPSWAAFSSPLALPRQTCGFTSPVKISTL